MPRLRLDPFYCRNPKSHQQTLWRTHSPNTEDQKKSQSSLLQEFFQLKHLLENEINEFSNFEKESELWQEKSKKSI
jgi:hypothetical protein